jgi:hypothetical protein
MGKTRGSGKTEGPEMAAHGLVRARAEVDARAPCDEGVGGGSPGRPSSRSRRWSWHSDPCLPIGRRLVLLASQEEQGHQEGSDCEGLPFDDVHSVSSSFHEHLPDGSSCGFGGNCLQTVKIHAGLGGRGGDDVPWVEKGWETGDLAGLGSVTLGSGRSQGLEETLGR